MSDRHLQLMGIYMSVNVIYSEDDSSTSFNYALIVNI